MANDQIRILRANEALTEVPDAVAQRGNWTWVRRKLQRPAIADKARMAAWLELRGELQMVDLAAPCRTRRAWPKDLGQIATPS
jgi:hypothetical protein